MKILFFSDFIFDYRIDLNQKMKNQIDIIISIIVDIFVVVVVAAARTPHGFGTSEFAIVAILGNSNTSSTSGI